MLAYAPLFPHPREEKWNFVVADAAANTVYARQEVSLIEAEAVGISHPVSLHQSAAIVCRFVPSAALCPWCLSGLAMGICGYICE